MTQNPKILKMVQIKYFKFSHIIEKNKLKWNTHFKRFRR